MWRGAPSRSVLCRIATRCVGLLGNLYSGPDEKARGGFIGSRGCSGVLGRRIRMAFSVRFWGLRSFSFAVVEWRCFNYVALRRVALGIVLRGCSRVIDFVYCVEMSSYTYAPLL